MLAPADPDLVPFDPPEHPSWRATFRNVIETYPRALYGERGCVRYRSGPWDTVFVTDPELIHDVLVARVDSFRRDDIARRVLTPALGVTALFMAEGAQWKWQRRAAKADPSESRGPLGRPSLALGGPGARIVANREDNRNGGSRRFGSERRRVAAGRRQNGHRVTNKLQRHCWQPIVLAERPAIFDRHVLASTKPFSPRPRRNAATRCAVSSGDRELRYPITGIAACCARAASGYAAAAPPRSVMNSRRFN
jgi:hypothetical protein